MIDPARLQFLPIFPGLDWLFELAIYNDEDGTEAKDLSSYTVQVQLRAEKAYNADLVLTLTSSISSFTEDGQTVYTVIGSMTDTQTLLDDIISQEYVYCSVVLIDGDGLSEPWGYGKVKIDTTFPGQEGR